MSGRGHDPAPARLLAWDSDFFGFTVARAAGGQLTPESADALDAWCQAQAVRCLYFLADAADPLTAQIAGERGYRFVDVRLTLEAPSPPALLPGVEGRRGQGLVRPFAAADLDALAAIARASYTDSRYYFDLGFPRERCDALYETWLRRDCALAVEAPSHHAVFVADAESDRPPVGFITCALSEETRDARVGEIGLLGVAAAAAGRGLAGALIDAALAWCGAAGAGRIRVVTQGRNLGAQRAYLRGGFLPRQVAWWFHKWYE